VDDILGKSCSASLVFVGSMCRSFMSEHFHKENSETFVSGRRCTLTKLQVFSGEGFVIVTMRIFSKRGQGEK